MEWWNKKMPIPLLNYKKIIERRDRTKQAKKPTTHAKKRTHPIGLDLYPVLFGVVGDIHLRFWVVVVDRVY
jgi:hypothetical protein